MKIGLHKLKDKVNIFIVLGADGLMQLHYVRVIQLPEDFYLTIGALGISWMLEGVEYLF